MRRDVAGNATPPEGLLFKQQSFGGRGIARNIATHLHLNKQRQAVPLAFSDPALSRQA